MATIPSCFNTGMPYLIVYDLETFIEFTQTVFGAEEKMRHTDENGRIVHAEVVIGNRTIMAGESTDQWNTQNAGLYINVDSADKTYLKALDAGARAIQELSDREYEIINLQGFKNRGGRYH